MTGKHQNATNGGTGNIITKECMMRIDRRDFTIPI